MNIVEYKYSTRLEKPIKLDIEIDFDNMTQKVIKRDNKPTYCTNNMMRKFKMIHNRINLNKLNISNYFYDVYQDIQYNFERIYKSPNETTNIELYTNDEIVDLKSILPDTIKVINIFEIKNLVQNLKYVNCMKRMYLHAQFNAETNKFISLDAERVEKMKKNIIGFQSASDKSNGIQPNEVIVFHGCYDNVFINSICENSFNPFLCNTALYGYGTYFSKTFEYCHRNGYSSDLGKNIYHMFVCRLVTGSYCIGSQNQRVPSLINKTQRYKTMVDNIQNPYIYAVQDPDQIEILYEIHYTKLNDKVYEYNHPDLHLYTNTSNEYKKKEILYSKLITDEPKRKKQMAKIMKELLK